MSPAVVTVVIPAFNAEAFVRNAIESVLAQSHPDHEIVVVDDCSSDGTSEVVRPYVEAGQVRLVCHERNQGVPAARNTAIRAGTGQYFAFLDADDLWRPNHLSSALAILEAHPTIDVVFFDFEVVELETGRPQGSWFASRRAALASLRTEQVEQDAFLVLDGLLRELLRESFIHMQAVVARRPVVEATLFDERLRHSEDLDWSIRVAHAGVARVAFSSRVTGVYHRHARSLTAKTSGNDEFTERTQAMLFEEYLRWPRLPDDCREALRGGLVERCLALAYFARTRGDLREAMRRLGQSARHGWRAGQGAELLKIGAASLGL